jgi:hypothetical protein
MIYRLYSSAGNSEGIDEYVGYYELDADGYCNRYLEIRSNGECLRYSTEHPADHFGQLPEGQWDESEAEEQKLGALVPITAGIFETTWLKLVSDNDK